MKNPPSITLKRYFCGVAECTFQSQLGVADPPLIDYLSNLLLRFVRTDSLQRLRNPAGRRLEALGEMVAEAESRVGEARRDVHRHIGDYALFWAGLYPESLRRRRGAGDRFEEYCSQGKRAYHVASSIDSDLEPSPDVLQRLSVEFEMCAYGLHEVRREIERGDDGEGPARPYLID